MYSLQTSVVMGDNEFHITNDGDFRMILDCFSAINDEELSEDFRVLASLIIFYEDINSIEDIAELDKETATQLTLEMFRFFNGGKDESEGAVTSQPTINWEQDEQIICAAVNNVAHTEIRSLGYLHWWTFLGYYMSVGESVLSTVVSIRNKMNKGKSLDKWEKEFKNENPKYFKWKPIDIEVERFEKELRELWNQGGEK